MAATALSVLLVDSHSIYRSGLAACLREQEAVAAIHEATDIPAALAHPALSETDVVVLDYDVPGAENLVRRIGRANGRRPCVVVLSARCDEERLLAAVQAGAVGFLSKDTLTPEELGGAVRAASNGAGVIAPELVGSLLEGLKRVSRDVLEPRGLSLSRLTDREQRVLSLIADGHPIREVAQELCYSERTVKNVLHDIVTKLNVRTRSQAIAHAVREGLI